MKKTNKTKASHIVSCVTQMALDYALEQIESGKIESTTTAQLRLALDQLDVRLTEWKKSKKMTKKKGSLC